MAVTTNFGWTLPTVSGDSGTWGAILNAAIVAIDAALKVVSDLAASAFPAASATGVIGSDGTQAAASTGVVPILVGYKRYEITLSDLLPSVDGAALNLRFSYDGGATYKSTFIYAYSGSAQDSTTNSVVGSASATSIYLAGTPGSASGYPNSAVVKLVVATAGNMAVFLSASYRNAAGAINNIDLSGIITGGFGTPTHMGVIPGSGNVSFKYAVEARKGLA